MKWTKLLTIIGLILLSVGIVVGAVFFSRREQVVTYFGPNMYGSNFWLHPYTRYADSVIETTKYTGKVVNVYEKDGSRYIRVNTADSNSEGTVLDVELPTLIDTNSMYVTEKEGDSILFSKINMDRMYELLGNESYTIEISISQIISKTPITKYISNIQFTENT